MLRAELSASRARRGEPPKGRAKGAPASGRPARAEVSAGGVVIAPTADGRLCAAVLGRHERGGGTRWLLPKGHVEPSERVEATAEREVAEETGLEAAVYASLGVVDFWFGTDHRRVHKTVHHFVLRATGGELSTADREVDEVAWIPVEQLAARLSYPQERELVARLPDLLAGYEAASGPVLAVLRERPDPADS